MAPVAALAAAPRVVAPAAGVAAQGEGESAPAWMEKAAPGAMDAVVVASAAACGAAARMAVAVEMGA